MYRRSGIAPFSTQAPLPSVPGEWHPSHTKVPYNSDPLRIVPWSAIWAGGFGTGGTMSGGVGKLTVPPNLNANNRAGPRLDCGVAMVQAGANNLDPEPHPTGVRTYCSPFTLKVIGTESIADPV